VRSRLEAPYVYTIEEEDKSPPWERFQHLVFQYTGRSLSYQTDALAAVSGVLNPLRRTDDPILSLCGLPYYRSACNGSFQPIEHTFRFALSWELLYRTRSVRRHMFPTWTWAGWVAAAQGVPSCPLSSDRSSFLRNVHIETSKRRRLEPSELMSRITPDEFQDTLESVVALIFEAPGIPADCVTVECKAESSDDSADDARSATEIVHSETHKIISWSGLSQQSRFRVSIRHATESTIICGG
jgi:hypothetical protein